MVSQWEGISDLLSDAWTRTQWAQKGSYDTLRVKEQKEKASYGSLGNPQSSTRASSQTIKMSIKSSQWVTIHPKLERWNCWYLGTGKKTVWKVWWCLRSSQTRRMFPEFFPSQMDKCLFSTKTALMFWARKEKKQIRFPKGHRGQRTWKKRA
jgi:hypothetical protein